ncbi:MAG: DHH family phosphoesterase [Nanoarchaeota archaeon]|nr:DHH family phosphoesterase [Nanoarchaeota archaeon]
MDETEIARVGRLIKRIQRAADTLRHFPSRIRVLAHNDSDGLASGAIITKALTREGKEFQLSFHKQLTKAVLHDLTTEPNRLFLFLDFGSGMITTIQETLLARDRVPSAVGIIADHHLPQGDVYSENLIHLSPHDFDITENISGAGMTYLLARAMNPENRELAELAIIGAIGDSQMGSVGPDWTLFGLNKEILKDAVSTGKIRQDKGLRLWGRYTRPLHRALQYSVDPYIPEVSGNEDHAIAFLQEIGIDHRKPGGFRCLADLSEDEQRTLADAIIKERVTKNIDHPDHIFGDVYDLVERDEYRDANEFTTLLNACGKLGNPGLGIALCLGDPTAPPLMKKVLASYRKEIGEGIRCFYANQETLLLERDKGLYVHARDLIGEHIISNVISTVHKAGVLPEKPVFALVHAADGAIKVSARASEALVAQGLNLGKILAAAAAKAGGEGGGHRGAAGALIPIANEHMLINSIEEILMSLGGSPKPVPEPIAATPDTYDRRKQDRGEGSTPREESRPRQKVERKGLVRYFGAEDV